MTGKFQSTMGWKLAAAAAVAVAGATLTTPAQADEPKHVDWMKILVDADRYVRTGTELAAPTPSSQQKNNTAVLSDDPNPQSLGNAWFGVAPRASLAFRDWRNSTKLAGDQLSLVEAMRLSASTRMLVGRARLSGISRFTPFFQMGVGQWRTDTTLLPLTPNTIEIASQIGTGFELRIHRRWQIAAETSVTSLIREQHDTSAVAPNSILWSTFVASRLEW